MPIRVAVIGVGNCASSLVQGLFFYRDLGVSPVGEIAGLMNHKFGGYKVEDIQIVAAFDINADKVGRDISRAIAVPPNNAEFFCEVPQLGVSVSPGNLFDGLPAHMKGMFAISEAGPEEVLNALKHSGAQICVNFLPVGARFATEFYADVCLRAGVAFINGMPELIASDPLWEQRFRLAGIPCAGDDVQSQIGATIIHRMLMDFLLRRGVAVDDSYQLDIGGNSDFFNMSDSRRVQSKIQSKTSAVALEAGSSKLSISPASYIPHLGDNKIAYINIRGRQFGDLRYEIELKMSVQDSPNNAGVMIDAIRAMKLSLDAGHSGYQEWSTRYFKHPLKYKGVYSEFDLTHE